MSPAVNETVLLLTTESGNSQNEGDTFDQLHFSKFDVVFLKLSSLANQVVLYNIVGYF